MKWQFWKKPEHHPAREVIERAEKERQAPSRLRRFFYWSAVAGVWLFMALGVYVAYLSADLPDLEALPPPGQQHRIEVRSENGSVLATYGAVYGNWIDYEHIPPVMIAALTSIEDRRFFDHWGVDVRGIVRAAWSNFRAGGITQGASTLTQQLTKNLFLTSERSIKRKVQELLLAIWLEQNFSKEDILTLYLNRVYFGSGAYGLDAASRKFFGHGAETLTLAESALLAGLMKAPSRLAPTRNPQAAYTRASLVLASMVEEGHITVDTAAFTNSNPAPIVPLSGADNRYFTDWVVAQLDTLNIEQGAAPLVVYTSLNLQAQRAAEEAVRQALTHEGAERNAGQAAMVVLSTDGAITAMIGGRSFSESQFNRAVSAKRQPGSAFKPFVYLAALDSGLSPTDTVMDAPITIDGWSPQNFSGTYQGEIPLYMAFRQSINTIAARLIERTGPETVIEKARLLGIESSLGNNPSLALGTSEVTPIELARAYAVIANGGYLVKPYAILEVRTASGQLIYAHDLENPARVLTSEATENITAMMEGTVLYGTGRNAQIDRPVAGKTGTSQDYRDAWFAGFTSDFVGVVWVGNDNNAPMQGVTGGGMPARIFSRAMREIHVGRPVLPLLADSGRFEKADRDNLDWVR